MIGLEWYCWNDLEHVDANIWTKQQKWEAEGMGSAI